MLKTLEAVFETQGSKRLNLKFKDGTEARASKDQDFLSPLEAGEEAWATFHTYDDGGRPYDRLMYWGPKPEPETMGQVIERFSDEPRVRRMNLDTRDKLIIAQVAFKEACDVARTLAVTTLKGGPDPLSPEMLKDTTEAYMKIIIEAAQKT